VQQNFGGPDSAEKAAWMVQAIETWFNENQGLETYEVEDFLGQVLNSEFDLILEDNSIQEIARLICLYYRLCQENKVAEIQQRLQSLPRPALHGCQQGAEQLDFTLDEDITPQQLAFSSHSSDPPPSTAQTHPTPLASSQSQSSNGNADSMETDEPEEDPDGWRVMRHGRKKR
ncbi:pre-rRNA-processing protein TSR2 homolog, partial [Elysia marginata]